ncbi:unnamed protein product [Tilletia controversa]|nr:unnamed protein product [Tilletia controversa]
MDDHQSTFSPPRLHASRQNTRTQDACTTEPEHRLIGGAGQAEWSLKRWWSPLIASCPVSSIPLPFDLPGLFLIKAKAKKSPYVPQGPSPDNTPLSSPAKGASARKRTAATIAAESAASDDELQGEDLPEEVFAVVKRFKLSNRATNTLMELNTAAVKLHNDATEHSDDEIDHAPASYLIEQSIALATWDSLRTMNQTLASALAERERPAASAPASTPSAKPDPNSITSDAMESKNIANITFKAFLSPSNPSLAAGGKILLQVVLIWSSQKESLDSAAANIREFIGTVAGKWGVDVSYDLIVRLAWLRKMGKEKVPIDEAGPDWWDNIQEELDIIVDMVSDKSDESKQQRGMR